LKDYVLTWFRDQTEKSQRPLSCMHLFYVLNQALLSILSTTAVAGISLGTAC